MHLSPLLSSRVSYIIPVLPNFLYLMQPDPQDLVDPIIILQHFETKAVIPSPVK